MKRKTQRGQPEILTRHGEQMLQGDHVLLWPIEKQEQDFKEEISGFYLKIFLPTEFDHVKLFSEFYLFGIRWQ